MADEQMVGRVREWLQNRLYNNGDVIALADLESGDVIDLMADFAVAEQHLAQATRSQLVKELLEEWSSNHAEHCTDKWPHDGRCHWSLPKSCRQMSASEVLAILGAPSGDTAGG